MNKEELKKEAEEYAKGMAIYYASTHEDYIPSQFEKYLRNAYISSAEPREKQIAELEAQIEKMKCCKEEIIKALKETLDYEWLHAHNGKAKYVYLQTVIDVVNEKFKEIKEKMTLCINGKTYEAGELVDYVKKLEKEIAELKSEKGCESCTKFDEVNLTKAKEIIKSLLDCLRQDTNDPQTNYYVCLYMTEAEQFLKEDGCPDVMCEDCTKEDCGIKKLGLVEVEK